MIKKLLSLALLVSFASFLSAQTSIPNPVTSLSQGTGHQIGWVEDGSAGCGTVPYYYNFYVGTSLGGSNLGISGYRTHASIGTGPSQTFDLDSVMTSSPTSGTTFYVRVFNYSSCGIRYNDLALTATGTGSGTSLYTYSGSNTHPQYSEGSYCEVFEDYSYFVQEISDAPTNITNVRVNLDLTVTSGSLADLYVGVYHYTYSGGKGECEGEEEYYDIPLFRGDYGESCYCVYPDLPGPAMSGTSLSGTTFDANASTLIYNGTPPYSGSFTADETLNGEYTGGECDFYEDTLSDLVGVDANGYWELYIYSPAGVTATVDNWTLEISGDSEESSEPALTSPCCGTDLAFVGMYFPALTFEGSPSDISFSWAPNGLGDVYYWRLDVSFSGETRSSGLLPGASTSAVISFAEFLDSPPGTYDVDARLWYFSPSNGGWGYVDCPYVYTIVGEKPPPGDF